MVAIPGPFGSPQELFALEGRVAIVTGASSGLGAQLVGTLAAAGARVVAAGRRTDRLADLAARVPGAVLPVTCDVTAEPDRQRLVETARAELGPVDVLVNNAGAIEGAIPAQDETLAGIERTFALNLVAPTRLAALVYPDMRGRGGSIVNIASVSGAVGIGRLPQASYAASKSGLVGLTRELAVQWARDDIRVNAIVAGFFASEMTAEMFEVPKLAEWVDRNTPLPRRGGVRDFAGMLLLLASDAGSYITGQALAVDGGWTAR